MKSKRKLIKLIKDLDLLYCFLCCHGLMKNVSAFTRPGMDGSCTNYPKTVDKNLMINMLYHAKQDDLSLLGIT